MTMLNDIEQFNAEFRGFFWADGYIYLHIDRQWKEKKQCWIWIVRLAFRIQQRDDNIQILENIKSRYGGGIYRSKKYTKCVSGSEGNPSATWQVGSKKDVRKVLEILEGGVMGAKKQQELGIIREALDIVDGRGSTYSKEESSRLIELENNLKASRVYKD